MQSVKGRVSLGAITVGLFVALSVSPASADYGNPFGGATSTSTDSGGVVQVGESGGGGGSGGSGGSSQPSPYTDCGEYPTWILNVPTIIDSANNTGAGLQSGHTQAEIDAATSWTSCNLVNDPTGTAAWLNNPATPGAELLVAFAEEQLELELPAVATSPVRGGLQLVGVPVWFWVDNFESTSTTAEVPGLSATLTATPVRTRFVVAGPGRGGANGTSETVVCEGPGTKWEPGSGADPWAGSDCSFAFDWSGTFTVESIVDWELTWSATNGQTGTLPAVSRTTTFTIDVEQAQAVVD